MHNMLQVKLMDLVFNHFHIDVKNTDGLTLQEGFKFTHFSMVSA